MKGMLPNGQLENLIIKYVLVQQSMKFLFNQKLIMKYRIIQLKQFRQKKTPSLAGFAQKLKGKGIIYAKDKSNKVKFIFLIKQIIV